jgi:hypothetical protein
MTCDFFDFTLVTKFDFGAVSETIAFDFGALIEPTTDASVGVTLVTKVESLVETEATPEPLVASTDPTTVVEDPDTDVKPVAKEGVHDVGIAVV